MFEVRDDVAGSIREWAHVQLFSPWRFDIDPAAARVLGANGWVAPDPLERPTGGDLIERYLKPLAPVPDISRGLRTNRSVIGVTRAGVETRPWRARGRWRR